MAGEQLELNFEEAFTKLMAEDIPPAPAVVPVETAPTPPEETISEEAPPVEETAPAAEEVAPVAEEQGEPAPEADLQAKPKAAEIDDDELLKRLASLVKKGAAPDEPAPAPEPAPAAEPELLSAEEKEFVSTYEKDWPDVAKAEALRRKVEYNQLVGYVFGEIAKEFRPVMEMVRTLSERTHLTDLRTTVQDYDDVREKVIDWVGKQPAYLQNAYQHVIAQGTADEVADLVARYKRETGASSPPPAPVKKETELPPAAKQAAAALAPVSSKRSGVTTTMDPNDFESAFASFASKL